MREVALIATQYSLPHVTRYMEHLVSGEGKHLYFFKRTKMWMESVTTNDFFYLAYCANPALGLNQHEVDECREKAHTYMGPAFRGFFLKTFPTTS